MKKYSLLSRFAHRSRLLVEEINSICQDYIGYQLSRDHAKRLRRKVISEKGRKITDRKTMKLIKSYCKNNFGSSSYWPWLALYTELRGEFKEGWIPEDYYRFDLLSKMNPEKYTRFSEAKVIDYKLFDEEIVEPLFLRLNGEYFGKYGNIKTKAEIRSRLRKINEEIIIKPDDGLGGKGIKFINSQEFCFNELPSNTNLVIQKVVKQHSELNKLYPHSINTFRVLTFLDKNGEIEVKFVILRFGKGGSRIDNASGGGGWIFIQNNGKPCPSAFDLEGNFYGKKHPDTKFKYLELNLPFIKKITAFCKNAHRNFPYTRIIGWDVFINEEGEPKLIEWNANNPFFGAIEAHFGPFFAETIE